jgi:hypothetical protein
VLKWSPASTFDPFAAGRHWQMTGDNFSKRRLGAVKWGARQTAF